MQTYSVLLSISGDKSCLSRLPGAGSGFGEAASQREIYALLLVR